MIMSNINNVKNNTNKNRNFSKETLMKIAY